MKKLLFLLMASFLVLVACGQEESKTEDKKETKSSDKESKEEDKKKDEDKKSDEEKDKSDDKSNEEVANEEPQSQEQQITEEPVQSQEQVNTQEQQPVQSQEQAPVVEEQTSQEIQGGNDAGAAEEQQAFLRESDPEYYEQFEGKTGKDLPPAPNGKHYGVTPTSEYSYSNDQLGPDGLPREDAVATDENGNPEPQ
ncbi:hypothetical protein [Staphylococcus equorum]|uniref:hypothetical protein n=1 Tax=Staphylococcus equorum TaxID=246432 RepID=UPI0008FB75D5|nr:hypothetical protein [Staphylococcus equorum]